jgi:hypothetical protein
VTEKVGSGAIRSKPTLAETLEQSSTPATRMGDPVLERWRPGGSVLAVRGQGVASIPELAAKLPWREIEASTHGGAWESARKNEMARELARAKESTTSPKPTKDRLGDEDGFDGRRAPEVSNSRQGALTRLKRSGVAAHLSLPPRCVGDHHLW